MKTILFSIWLLLGLGYWYVANQYCGEPTSVLVEVNSPFYFEKDGSDIIATELFQDYKDELSLRHPAGSELTIVGYMTPEEEANNSNIGLERAQALKNHLGLSDYQIKLESETVEKLEPNSQYASVDLADDQATSMQDERTPPSSQDKPLVVENEVSHTVNAQVEKHYTIYFPFNSTQKLEGEQVNTYLNGIANRVLGTGETVVLTGYTDKVGSKSYNYQLGEKRAYAIKDYLVSRGVNPRKILTVTKGEGYTQGNNSKDNLQDDRRVELLLLN